MPRHCVSLSNICLPFFSSHLRTKNSIEFEKISGIPNFENSLVNTHLSSEEIQKIVTPILKYFFSKVHYTRLNLTCQFIDYYNKLDRQTLYEITPLKALETFTPDVQRTIEITNGGSCYEFIKYITERLPNSLKSNLVSGSAPMWSPKYCHKLSHIAAVIVYNDPKNSRDTGFILLDPSFKLDEPVTIPLHGVSKPITSLSGYVFVFCHEKDTILGKIVTTRESGEIDENLCITYFLKKITNFIDVAIKPLIACTRNISLMTYGNCFENNSDLRIRLDKEIITWGVGSEWKPIITFNEFLTKKFRFGQNFSKSSLLDINQVNDSIEKIILNKRLLQTLHLEYINILRKNPQSQEFLTDT
ncbi:MAG: hypothetical protein ACRCSV_05820 [Chlamydiales bacterium]